MRIELVVNIGVGCEVKMKMRMRNWKLHTITIERMRFDAERGDKRDLNEKKSKGVPLIFRGKSPP